MLFIRLTQKLKTCTSHCVDVLKASISLILFAIAELKVLLPSDKTYQKDEIIAKRFANLKDSLWHWIVCSKVIGGSVFGGTLPVQSSSSSSWKTKEELVVIPVVIHALKYFDLSCVTRASVWQSLLSLEEYPHDQQVTEEWHNIVKAHIHKRTNQVEFIQ